MKPPGELAVHRRLTNHFISTDYTDIILHTRVEGTGDNKGVLVAGPDRPSQRFRLIPQNISPQSGARWDATELGTNTFLFVLMGNWDAVIELYDWWESPNNGQRYQVDTVLPFNGYEQKGCINLYRRSK